MSMWFLCKILNIAVERKYSHYFFLRVPWKFKDIKKGDVVTFDEDESPTEYHVTTDIYLLDKSKYKKLFRFVITCEGKSVVEAKSDSDRIIIVEDGTLVNFDTKFGANYNINKLYKLIPVSNG